MNGAKEWKNTSFRFKINVFLVGSLSASAEKTHHSALILPNKGSWVMNRCGRVQSLFLCGAGNAGILCFSCILSVFSAWSHELK